MKTQTKPFENYQASIMRWLSDFDFFRTELYFFDKMLERDLLFVPSDEQSYLKIQEYKKRLNNLSISLISIRSYVKDYMNELEAFVKDYRNSSHIIVKRRYDEVHDLIVNYITDYRLYREDLFHEADLLASA